MMQEQYKWIVFISSKNSQAKSKLADKKSNHHVYDDECLEYTLLTYITEQFHILLYFLHQEGY